MFIIHTPFLHKKYHFLSLLQQGGQILSSQASCHQKECYILEDQKALIEGRFVYSCLYLMCFEYWQIKEDKMMIPTAWTFLIIWHVEENDLKNREWWLFSVTPGPSSILSPATEDESDWRYRKRNIFKVNAKSETCWPLSPTPSHLLQLNKILKFHTDGFTVAKCLKGDRV